MWKWQTCPYLNIWVNTVGFTENNPKKRGAFISWILPFPRDTNFTQRKFVQGIWLNLLEEKQLIAAFGENII